MSGPMSDAFKALNGDVRIRFTSFVFKTNYFHLWFLYKSDFRLSCFRLNKKIFLELKTFKARR